LTLRDVAEKWANFVLANLLWAFFLVPIVTIPAATAGLFSVMGKRVRNKPSVIFTEFFGAMRRLWLKATIIGVIDIVLGGLLVLNIWIFRQMGEDIMAMLARSVTAFVGMVLVLTNLYVWPLLVSTELPLRELIATAIKLMATHPIRSITVFIAGLSPIAVSLLLPRGVYLFVTASACAMLITMGIWPIIQEHVSEDVLTSY
jgi:uncharacterized membrane protein YesL